MLMVVGDYGDVSSWPTNVANRLDGYVRVVVAAVSQCGPVTEPEQFPYRDSSR